MVFALQKIGACPIGVRVVPFVVFVALTALQGKLGSTSPYWAYAAKTLLGGWLLWMWRHRIPEMRWRFSLAAVGTGVAVFVMWVGLDGWFQWLGFSHSYPKFGRGDGGWNPPLTFGADSALAWLAIVVRILGSSLVVPPLEEVFYRSFLYRYIAKPDFESVPIGQFLLGPFLIASVLFGFSHFEWLAGVLCGFAYQGLVCCKKRLGDAITAHAITNFLLALWVVWRGAWAFW